MGLEFRVEDSPVVTLDAYHHDAFKKPTEHLMPNPTIKQPLQCWFPHSGSLLSLDQYQLYFLRFDY
jgi:hypothetical protein